MSDKAELKISFFAFCMIIQNRLVDFAGWGGSYGKMEGLEGHKGKETGKISDSGLPDDYIIHWAHSVFVRKNRPSRGQLKHSADV